MFDSWMTVWVCVEFYNTDWQQTFDNIFVSALFSFDVRWNIIFYHARTCVWYGYVTSVFMEIIYGNYLYGGPLWKWIFAVLWNKGSKLGKLSKINSVYEMVNFIAECACGKAIFFCNQWRFGNNGRVNPIYFCIAMHKKKSHAFIYVIVWFNTWELKYFISSEHY